MVLGEGLAFHPPPPHSELSLVAVDIPKCIWRESQDNLNFSGRENSSVLLQQEENIADTDAVIFC